MQSTQYMSLSVVPNFWESNVLHIFQCRTKLQRCFGCCMSEQLCPGFFLSLVDLQQPMKMQSRVEQVQRINIYSSGNNGTAPGEFQTDLHQIWSNLFNSRSTYTFTRIRKSWSHTELSSRSKFSFCSWITSRRAIQQAIHVVSHIGQSLVT